MHQQGFDRVAGRRVLGLAVERQPQGLLQIGRRIHIEMTDAVGMAQHRDAGVVLDEAHQLVGAAGNDQIHQAIELEHGQALGPGGEQLQGLRIHGAGGQAALQGGMNGRTAATGLAAPLEQGAVAGANGERSNLHHRIGPGFEDHPHHPERHAEALQHQPIVEFGVKLAATERVFEGGHLAHPLDGAIKLGGIELEAGHQGCGQAIGGGGIQIGTVQRQDRLPVGLEGIGHGQQGAAALGVTGLGQPGGGSPHRRRPGQQLGRGLGNGSLGGQRRGGNSHPPIIQPAQRERVPCGPNPPMNQGKGPEMARRQTRRRQNVSRRNAPAPTGPPRAGRRRCRGRSAESPDPRDSPAAPAPPPHATPPVGSGRSRRSTLPRAAPGGG